MSLQPIFVEKPFSQWGLDVIGTINPKSSKGHTYILTATDYFTKWPEAVALERVDSEELIKFIKDNILSIFGIPDKIITDNGSIFISSKLHNFVENMELLWGGQQTIIHKGMVL
jgi:hypothetical protein